MLRNLRVVSIVLVLALYLMGTAQAAVSDYSTDWSVNFLAGTPSYYFDIIPPGQTQFQVYKPNTLSRIGLGGAWRGYGVDVTWANAQSAEQQQKMGSTQNTDYSLSVYWKMLALDIFLQDYKGFYVDNTADSSGVYLQYRAAKSVHAGAQLYYVFSPERYTMSSAFQQTTKQTDSGGSWVVSTYLNTFSIDTGPYTANAFPGLGTTYQSFSLSSSNLGVAGGYGYSLRSNGGHWYASLQMLTGLGYQLRKYQQNGNTEEGSGVGSKVTLHFGVGWTGEAHAAGIVGLADKTGYGGDKTPVNELRAVTSTASTGRVFYMYRF